MPTDSSKPSIALGLPLSFPKSEDNGLTMLKRFELSAILGGGVVTLVGAVFLIGEYQDQKQARITRAWDLLHKATERARERMDAAESEIFQNGIVGLGGPKDGDLRDQATENDYALVKKAIGCKNLSEPEVEKLTLELDALKEVARACAARGNDGQLGALQTLNEAGVSLENIRLEGIDLTKVQLPGAQLSYAQFKHADLEDANLGDASLHSSDLSEGDLYEINLRNAKMSFANLWRTDLRYADFENADLQFANLAEVELEFTNFSFASLQAAKVNDAELIHAEFCETTMPDGSVCNRDCGGSDTRCPYLDEQGNQSVR